MKKVSFYFKSLFILTLIFIFSACSDSSLEVKSISDAATELRSMQETDEDVNAIHLNWGYGALPPAFIGFDIDECNYNGVCPLYIGPWNPTGETELNAVTYLLDNETMRIIRKEPLDEVTEDLVIEDIVNTLGEVPENINTEALTTFVNTHFIVTQEHEFSGEFAEQINEKYIINTEDDIYIKVLEGDYEIVTSEVHPYGYADVKIDIEEKPYIPCSTYNIPGVRYCYPFSGAVPEGGTAPDCECIYY